MKKDLLIKNDSKLSANQFKIINDDLFVSDLIFNLCDNNNILSAKFLYSFVKSFPTSVAAICNWNLDEVNDFKLRLEAELSFVLEIDFSSRPEYKGGALIPDYYKFMENKSVAEINKIVNKAEELGISPNEAAKLNEFKPN